MSVAPPRTDTPEIARGLVALAVRHVTSRCPLCGEAFYVSGAFWVNSFAWSCGSCGLDLYPPGS